jgi:4-alpha-glucanotransferase
MSEAHSSKPRRIAGVTVPLFSLRSARSWGIGEIGDLPDFAAFARGAGLRLVQILPLGEISGGETSPYSALSAFGIDPMFLSMAGLADLEGESAGLGAAGALLLARARASATVDYEAVRALKREALGRAFRRFRDVELANDTPRARELAAFRAAHRAWLDDYALFRALKDAHGGSAWWDWSVPLQRRDPAALAEASARLADGVLAHVYTQWLAHAQWAEARAHLASIGVEIMGDLPFMVGRDSSDVWAHQEEFRNECSVGCPPDAFSEEGQEWGLPPYHWERMRANGYAWLHRRARYTASLYDRFRIDHLVGFYRTYMRPVAGLRDAKGRLAKGFFDPAAEPDQLAHGERVIGAMLEGARDDGAQLIAEDLGVIPDFVRRSLTALGVPGYKVLIWEKDGLVFRDPAKFPAISLACFGTHDTDPVAVWWEALPEDERAAVKKLPLLAPHARELGAAFTPAVHRALVTQICAAGSELVLLLLQDVLGTRDRINTPGTTTAANWTYRLPAPVADLARDPRVLAAMTMVRERLDHSGRS